MGLGITRRNWFCLLAWSTIFAANLIVPLLFAWDLTRDRGRIGMAAAIGGWWALSALICVRSRVLATILFVGAALVAISQVWPILHVIAGTVGLELAATGTSELYPILGMKMTEGGGFVATAVTGAVLMLFALGSGCALIGGIRLSEQVGTVSAVGSHESEPISSPLCQ